MLDAGRYKANFSRGGLMVPESRIIADLLLRGIDPPGWKQAIEVDNLLAKRSPTTASTKATLIRGRLRTLTPALWRLIRDGSKPVATQAVLAATVNYSPLLGDFLELVLRPLVRRFEPNLKPQHWDRYLEDCRTRDPDMPAWSAATLETLRTRAFGMLAEAGYLSDARQRRLQPLRLAPEVAQALKDAGQFETLRRLTAGSPDSESLGVVMEASVVPGATGAAGATGVAGESGAVGATGAAGTSGAAGATGVVKASGVVGLTGAAGATGVASASGVGGPSEAAGASG